MREKKLLFSKCFLKHKLDSKTVIEAEHKARTDQEYTDIVKHYADAESNLIKLNCIIIILIDMRVLNKVNLKEI
jgi:hypothetical protein